MFVSSDSLIIDRTQAIAQLTSLGYRNGQTVYLRFFFPDGDSRKDSDKGRNLEGKFPNLPWPLMEKFQAEGRGCYFVVNGCGHNDARVTQCRAIFCEHDDLSKDLQRDLWRELRLPEPTTQVDSGGKSIHNFWKFKTFCTPEQWRELQGDLLEFVDGDRKLKNPSRVMRLAGAYHFKPGRDPVQSNLILNTEKSYSYEELRDIVPRQTKQQPKSEPTGIRWHEFEKSFQLPIDDRVPLYECLSKTDRELIDRGAAQGGRNACGYALAANLIATTDYLSDIGQYYEGDPQQLFDQCCQNCTPPIDSGEAEAIWKSANQRTKSASLPPHTILNCIKGWKWRQIRGENQQPSDTPISDRSSSNNVVDYPTARGKGQQAEEEKPLRDHILEILNRNLSASERKAEFIELSQATGVQVREIKHLAEEIEGDLASASNQADTTKETNNLLAYRDQTIDLKRVFPAPLASCLLSKADSDRVDPAFVYQYAWGGVGISLGTHIGIRGKEGANGDDWVEYPIYYNVVVAPPSAGKSQTMRAVLGGIKEKQFSGRAKYKKAQDHLEKLKERWRGMSSAQQEDLSGSERDPEIYMEQMPPKPETRLIEAGSPEGAFKRMSDLPPMSGCTLAFDELIRLLSLDQYKNQGGDSRQLLLEAWSHPLSTSFERSDDKDTRTLNKLGLNIIGGVQPAKTKKLLSDPDDGDGLLSRFLIATTKTPADFAVWSDIKVSISQALEHLYQKLEDLHYSLRKIVFGDNAAQSLIDEKQVTLRFDAIAEKRWRQWWEQVRREQQKSEHENPAFSGYIGKILSQTLRLALGLHCIELTYEDKPDPLLVGLDTLERAIYAAKFHIGQFKLLQAQNDTDSLPGHLEKIYQYVKRNNDPVSATQVEKAVFRRSVPKITLPQIRDHFRELANTGAVFLIGDGKDLKIKVVGIPTKSDTNSDMFKKPTNISGYDSQGGYGENSDNSDKNKNFETPTKSPESKPNQEADGKSNTGKNTVGSLHVANLQTVTEGCEDVPQASAVTVAKTPTKENCRNCRDFDTSESSTLDGELNTGVEILSETLSESVGIPTDFEKADQKAVTDLEAITLKIGDRVSDLNGQLGIVELLYPDGEVGVAHDNGQFKMWKPSELTIVIPDDDGDPDSNGSGNLPVTPKPNNDDGGVVQFEPLEQAVAEATDDVAVTTSSAQKTSQQIPLALMLVEAQPVPVTLPTGVEWLDPNSSNYQEQCQVFAATRIVSLDIETYQADTPKRHVTPKALHPWQSQIRLIQLCIGEKTFLVDLGDRNTDFTKVLEKQQPTIDLLRQVIQNPDQRIVGHNIHFDLRFLATKLGIRNAKNVVCTRLGAQVYYGDYGKLEGQPSNGKHEPILTGGYSLANLAHRLLDTSLDKREQKSDWGAVLTSEQIKYASLDPQTTLQIYEALEALYIDKQSPLYSEGLRDCWRLECDAIACAVEIELAGLPLDADAAKQQLDTIEAHRTTLLEEWVKLCPDLKYTQRDKLLNHLNQEYQLGLVKLDKGSLGQQSRDNPLIQIKLKLQGLDQCANNLKGFLTSAARDGRVHTTYKTLTGTGRFSSGGSASDLPNLQAIKAKSNPVLDVFNLPSVREVIKPRPGRTMAVIDLAGAHGRIAASETQDPTAIAGNNDTTIDNHLKVAVFVAASQGLDWTAEYMGKVRKDSSNPDSTKAKLFRDTAKNTYYGWLNGAGAVRIQEQITSNTGITPALEACEAAIEGCKSLYPGVLQHRKQLMERLRTNAINIDSRLCAVNNISDGFRICMPLVSSKFDEGRLEAPYTQSIACIWSRIEATAVKKALIQIMQLREQHPEWNLEVINYVHDEIDIEVDSEVAGIVVPLVNNIIGDSFTALLNSVNDGRETDWQKLVVDSWADK